MAKEFFKEHAIEFEEYDVLADEAKRAEMTEISDQMGVPVIVVPAERSTTNEQEVIVGFDRNRLGELLGVS